MPTYGPNDRRDRGGWRRDQMLRPRASGRFARAGEPSDSRELHRMQWRAAGAQFYPGGAYEQLLEISHRGRGPKGYQRSDELLKEIVCETLTDDPLIDARDVEVEVANGEVALRGSVEARQQKYAIEDRIADIAGVTEIHNYLSVSNRDIEDRTSGL